MDVKQPDFVHKGVRYSLIPAKSDACHRCAFERENYQFETCQPGERKCTGKIYSLDSDPANLVLHRLIS